VGQETIDLISLYQCITPELAGGKKMADQTSKSEGDTSISEI